MYTPDPTLLKKYADILIKFALNSGKGINKGDVVFIQVPESAKPMVKPLMQAVLEEGGHPMLQYLIDDDSSRMFMEMASDEQLTFFPQSYFKERVNVANHFVSIIAEYDKFEMKGIDSKRIMERGKAAKFYRDARNDKEYAGKLTWTLALYGTPAMAQEARMRLDEYWEQIIQACYLDYDDPIAKWRDTENQIITLKEKLNDLKIEWLHVEADDIDLKVKIGAHHTWLGGSGRNIPSFELFISPDWRGTEGTIAFSEPLYRYGNLIKGIKLEFKDGKVVHAEAQENEQLLKDMIAVEGADKVGEFSLTDRRFSRITKFMGETLFDENVGGEWGNTHIALGMAYKDSYDGDPSTLSQERWAELGYNDSAIHTDIVSTTRRTVTATLADGSEKVIYKDGEFMV